MDIALTGNNKDTVREDMKNTWGVTVRKAVVTVLAVEAVEAVKAVAAVDRCLGRLEAAVRAAGGALIVTADHGNCEQMIDPETGGIHTAHTTYEVDLIVVDDRYTGHTLRSGGRLADIAPTALHLLGLAQPAEMTGESLL